MCAFAAFGGIFFGYDSGYISGVMGMTAFYKLIDGADATALSATNKSLITSILSAGTLYVFRKSINAFLGSCGCRY